MPRAEFLVLGYGHRGTKVAPVERLILFEFFMFFRGNADVQLPSTLTCRDETSPSRCQTISEKKRSPANGRQV